MYRCKTIIGFVCRSKNTHTVVDVRVLRKILLIPMTSLLPYLPPGGACSRPGHYFNIFYSVASGINTFKHTQRLAYLSIKNLDSSKNYNGVFRVLDLSAVAAGHKFYILIESVAYFVAQVYCAKKYCYTSLHSFFNDIN